MTRSRAYGLTLVASLAGCGKVVAQDTSDGPIAADGPAHDAPCAQQVTVRGRARFNLSSSGGALPPASRVTPLYRTQVDVEITIQNPGTVTRQANEDLETWVNGDATVALRTTEPGLMPHVGLINGLLGGGSWTDQAVFKLGHRPDRRDYFLSNRINREGDLSLYIGCDPVTTPYALSSEGYPDLVEREIDFCFVRLSDGISDVSINTNRETTMTAIATPCVVGS